MAEDKILVILPTRNRREKVLEYLEAFEDTISDKSNVDLCIAIDDDDQDTYKFISYPDNAFVEVNPRMRMCPTVNLIADKYKDKYSILAFTGDDHRFRTTGWDITVKEQIEGVLYGNDLLQGEALPTAVFIKSEIVKTLGYMIPKGLVHMYADNFWKLLGHDIGRIKYLPELIIEHMHFSNGKSVQDNLYSEVNSTEVFNKDAEYFFNGYLKNEYPQALEKLKNDLSIK